MADKKPIGKIVWRSLLIILPVLYLIAYASGAFAWKDKDYYAGFALGLLVSGVVIELSARRQPSQPKRP